MRLRSRLAACLAAIALVSLTAGCTLGLPDQGADVPVTRWDHRPEARDWTEAALGAISTKGRDLVETEPADISYYCPGYAGGTEDDRAAFWVGLMSALAKYESGWRPEAAGAGGLYRGLMQIAPATARSYGCDAATLYEGTENLSCAVSIASRQVGRTGLVAGAPGQWGGLALDWGPMRSAAKRSEIAAWTRAQDYCRG